MIGVCTLRLSEVCDPGNEETAAKHPTGHWVSARKPRCIRLGPSYSEKDGVWKTGLRELPAHQPQIVWPETAEQSDHRAMVAPSQRTADAVPGGCATTSAGFQTDQTVQGYKVCLSRLATPKGPNVHATLKHRRSAKPVGQTCTTQAFYRCNVASNTPETRGYQAKGLWWKEKGVC